MESERERFLAACYTGPLLRADAIIVLAGEDAAERGNAAAELFRQDAAPVIVCTGGLHDPPRRVDGAHLAGSLMARGIAPDRIIVEPSTMDTHQQAVTEVERAELNEWRTLLLIASAYHLPRALLTFIKAIGERPIRVIPVPAAQLPWWASPPGMSETRIHLLTSDLAKVDQYAEHCATFAEGLAYLKRWDGV